MRHMYLIHDQAFYCKVSFYCYMLQFQLLEKNKLSGHFNPYILETESFDEHLQCFTVILFTLSSFSILQTRKDNKKQ